MDNFMDNKKQEQSKQQEQPSQLPQPKMRQIIIEFNQSNINIVKAEISSNFELQAILENILKKIQIR